MAATTLKLIALVLPLGLDTLGVAFALGAAGLPARRRTRVALLFAAFEAIMPVVGVAVGAPIGRAAGAAADYAAALLVGGLGTWMLCAGDRDEARLLSLTDGSLVGAAALGLSISLDELAIGFSAGLLRLPLVAMVIAIAVQAFLVTQVGVRLGARVGERWREAPERLAGCALIVLAAALVAARLL